MVSDSDELKCQCSSTEPEVNTGNAENWLELSITGDKPTPRFNVNILQFIAKFAFNCFAH